MENWIRFAGKPVEFGPAAIGRLIRWRHFQRLPFLHGDMNPLVLCQRKGFQRTQHTLFVNGLKMYSHADLLYRLR